MRRTAELPVSGWTRDTHRPRALEGGEDHLGEIVVILYQQHSSRLAVIVQHPGKFRQEQFFLQRFLQPCIRALFRSPGR